MYVDVNSDVKKLTRIIPWRAHVHFFYGAYLTAQEMSHLFCHTLWTRIQNKEQKKSSLDMSPIPVGSTRIISVFWKHHGPPLSTRMQSMCELNWKRNLLPPRLSVLTLLRGFHIYWTAARTPSLFANLLDNIFHTRLSFEHFLSHNAQVT